MKQETKEKNWEKKEMNDGSFKSLHTSIAHMLPNLLPPPTGYFGWLSLSTHHTLPFLLPLTQALPSIFLHTRKILILILLQ